MSKKKEDLQAILDLLSEWAIDYSEDYVTLCIVNNTGHGNLETTSADYEDVRLFKKYETPAAGTARESK